MFHPGRGRHDGLHPRVVPGGRPDLQGRLGRGRQPVPAPVEPELLASGGTASGPVSFMRGADASAGTIKSGGATRRAAKMVVLDVDHPDIEEFIETKAKEEEKSGPSATPGSTWTWRQGHRQLQYQNANNSVRVSEEFMTAVERDGDFDLAAGRPVRPKDGQGQGPVPPDGPGHLGVRRPWHPVRRHDQRLAHLPESGRITASNPCSSTSTWTTRPATWPASTC